MIVTKIFTAIIGTSLLLTSCVSSQKWIDDDVYVLKAVDIPTDTDVSDETDYATFLLNKETQRSRTTYYNDFYVQSYNPFAFRPYHILAGYSLYGYNNFYGRNLGWGFDYYNYNLINGYGYNYYGINCYNSQYGYWGGYGNNYYSNNYNNYSPYYYSNNYQYNYGYPSYYGSYYGNYGNNNYGYNYYYYPYSGYNYYN